MNEETHEYNAGDANQVGRRQKRKKLWQMQKQSALRSLMGVPEGRMWMWDLLGQCGVFHLSFSSDALVMAFNEGKRGVGNQLLAEINRTTPELYMKMVIENQNPEKGEWYARSRSSTDF